MHKLLVGAACAFIAILTISVAQDLRAQENQGKVLIQNRCTKCHTLKRVKAHMNKLDAKGWSDTVKEMIGKGADLTPEEREVVVNFLSRNSPGDLN
jgi:hypothetical protein